MMPSNRFAATGDTPDSSDNDNDELQVGSQAAAATEQTSTSAITAAAAAEPPKFSPDGGRIVYIMDKTLAALAQDMEMLRSLLRDKQYSVRTAYGVSKDAQKIFEQSVEAFKDMQAAIRLGVRKGFVDLPVDMEEQERLQTLSDALFEKPKENDDRNQTLEQFMKLLLGSIQ